VVREKGEREGNKYQNFQLYQERGQGNNPPKSGLKEIPREGWSQTRKAGSGGDSHNEKEKRGLSTQEGLPRT